MKTGSRGCKNKCLKTDLEFYEDIDFKGDKNWINFGDGKIDPEFREFLKSMKPSMLKRTRKKAVSK